MSQIAAPKKVWTEAELQALPEDGVLHEVVDGELVMSPKNNFQHENICTRLFFALQFFNQQHKLGVVLGSSAGFWMQNRNCRAPDISFLSKARVEALGFQPNTKQFFPGAPDLAVEILSPGQSRAEIDSRLQDFFASGTQLAWIINPDLQSVQICHSLAERLILRLGAELTGESLLPGFRYPIADLFKPWDWD